MYIEMEVGGLTLDPLTNSPVLVLRDLKGEKVLPIWIGTMEATAIATILEKVDVGRPMTHDLLKTMILELGGRILRVEICDLRMNTYYALIHLEQITELISPQGRPGTSLDLPGRIRIYRHKKVIEIKKEAVNLRELGKKQKKLQNRKRRV